MTVPLKLNVELNLLIYIHFRQFGNFKKLPQKEGYEPRVFDKYYFHTIYLLHNDIASTITVTKDIISTHLHGRTVARSKPTPNESASETRCR